MAPVPESMGTRLFRAIHNRHLIYNACWEDPAVDHRALNLQADDRVLVFTSGGCKALDYLLAGVAEVNAVDMNPVQNALLNLKRAAIRSLNHTSFFAMFGRGGSPDARSMYHDALRSKLTAPARRWWDKHIGFLLPSASFYHCGLFGRGARLALAIARQFHGLGKPIDRLLEAQTIDQQQAVYDAAIRQRIWKPWLRWVVAANPTLSLLGMPPDQGRHMAHEYPFGMQQFITDALEAILTRLPFQENYHWRVYLQGHYTPACCPEYLKPTNFARLKAGLIDRLCIHTGTINDVLRRISPGISRFVLLDHMDWMSGPSLRDEWSLILLKARPGSRVIFRSCGLRMPLMGTMEVPFRGKEIPVRELFRYHTELANELHAQDRVHTYGSFSIADLLETEGG